MTKIPGINSPLDVLVGDDVDVCRSRMEDAEGDILTIAALTGARRHNRRRFVRSSSGEPVQLFGVDPAGDGTVVTGVIADIGERSARCVLPVGAYVAGDVVQVRLAVGAGFVETTAEVVSTRRQKDSLGVDVVVAYDLAEQEAGTIRRHVFEQQQAERRRRQLFG